MPENQSKPATVQSAQSEERPQILVITGISGAGRSTVANVLEDEAGTLSITSRRRCSVPWLSW